MGIITVKAKFNRHKKLQADGKGTIELEIYQPNPRIRKYISTGISVKPSFWNAADSIVGNKDPNAPHLNKILRDAIKNIEDFAYSIHASGKQMTEQMLVDFLQGKKTKNESFLDFFSREIDPSLKRGTRKEHLYTYNLLHEFKNDILFSEVNFSFVQEFDRFLRFEKKLKQNTIHKHHQHVNRFLKLATQKELFNDSKNPYHNFRSKKEKSDRISLTPDELSRIENINTQPYPELMHVKNMFLFACYTGLRFSDVITLERKNIIEGLDGICIVKKMEKVPKPITLPLALLFDGKPLQILNQYSSDPVFPQYSNQHTNRLLKVIATISNTPMRLTFHIARHTFGSMLAELTHNPYLIMDLMGHADIKTSMIYIHRSQERINKQLRGVKWSLD